MNKSILLVAVAALIMSVSCSKNNPDQDPENSFNRVFVMFSGGYNNLVTYLQRDQSDIIGEAPDSKLPLKGSGDVAVLVSHLSVDRIDYETPTPTYIIRMCREGNGTPVLDTLKTYPPETRMTDRETLRDIFNFVLTTFPARHYGALYSSHGTGWLPEGYYNNMKWPSKSIGCEAMDDGKKVVSVETDIKDFAAAIPMHLDYLLLDACLMGCVEVAYELKDVVDKVAFSGTEILAAGFDYTKILDDLFPAGGDSNPEAVCRDYFAQYVDGRSGGATISLVDCKELDGLAKVCKRLFEQYRDQMNAIKASNVQGFFQSNKHFCYDLADIMDNAGLSAADKAEFKAALDKCILYKANTVEFQSVSLRTWCGMSMYLPANGYEDLKDYYMGLAWIRATSLVK